MGIVQARILEWVAIPSSRGSSQPRDQTQVSHIAGMNPGKPKNTGVDSPIPSPGDLPNPGIKPGSPALQADSLPTELPGKAFGCCYRLHFTDVETEGEFECLDQGLSNTQVLRATSGIWTQTGWFQNWCPLKIFWLECSCFTELCFCCTARWTSCVFTYVPCFLNFLPI